MAHHAHDHGAHHHEARGHGAHDHGAHDDWEARAAHYNDVVDLLEPEMAKVTSALLRAAHVGPARRVLDLACGGGHTAAAAHAAGADATGLDASPAMLAFARPRFPGVRFVEGDMATPPAGPWDAITCRFGAHHADPAWLKAALAVLRPGGRLAIAETGAPDEAARAKGMLDPQEWVDLLSAAGYVDVQVLPADADLSRLPHDVLDAATTEDEGGRHGPPLGPIHVIVGRRPDAPNA